MLQTYTNNPDFVPGDAFLSDEAMVEMYDGRPCACVDVLVVNAQRNTVFLTTRKDINGEGLWFIGGGIKRSQPLEVAAAKAVERETQQVFDPERFTFLTVNRFVWDKREEQPQANGRVDINFCFTIELTDDEIASLNLDDREYQSEIGLREFNREQLETALRSENDVKQALLNYYDLVFPQPTTSAS